MMSNSLTWLMRFNPRSRVGSDLIITTRLMTLMLFQSTLPRGERHRHDIEDRNGIPVSIHAPAWGATFCCTFIISHSAFQSTLPRGERPTSWVDSPSLMVWFQSTLPRGERLALLPIQNEAGTFQSTLPRGERPKVKRILISSPKFQSTLPRGERPGPLVPSLKSWEFQSTLPRGERLLFRTLDSACQIRFNPRSRVGSDFEA